MVITQFTCAKCCKSIVGSCNEYKGFTICDDCFEMIQGNLGLTFKVNVESPVNKETKEDPSPDVHEKGSQFYKADNGKHTIHYVPMEGIRAVARVREYGHKKYGDGADRFYECDPIRYVDAAFRHLMKIAEEGLDSVDDESGLPHTYHLATNAFFLIDIQKRRNENGDLARASEEKDG